MERPLWGEFEAVLEESEDEPEEEPDEPMDMTEIPTDGFESTLTGLVTPSGMTSISTGLETPDNIELRKETRRFVSNSFLD